MEGLSNLIEGTVLSYLGEKHPSVKCYRKCLSRRLPSKDSTDQHVSAFALYELGSTLCEGIVSLNIALILFIYKIFIKKC